MLRTLIIFALLILLAGQARAQDANGCPPSNAPCVATRNLQFLGTASVSATSTSANAVLGSSAANQSALITNGGSGSVWVQVGNSSVTAVVNGGAPNFLVPAGQSIAVPLYNPATGVTATYIAAITQTGTATVTALTGVGFPAITFGSFLTANITIGSVTLTAPSGITFATTSAAAGSLIAKASAGTFYSVLLSSSVGGYAMIFDSATVPADGAVTPRWVWPILANTPYTFTSSPNPSLPFASGITIVISTTGPYTKTISATGAITVEYQ